MNILHASTSYEWYTPARYLDAARALLGGIELDPASSDEANRIVRASRYYTCEQDGLVQSWRARSLWLNPPYGKTARGVSHQALWSTRLCEAYARGDVEQAVLLVNATPSNRWFAPLWRYPVCLTDHRIRFVRPDGKPATSPTHSNAFVYFGREKDRFVQLFSAFGTVVERLQVGACV